MPVQSKKIAVGTGLIALDAVEMGEGKYKVFAAGSNANVLTILSHWGWNAYPAGRIGRDKAAEYVINDLNRWNVNTHFIQMDPTITTPIYIQKIDPHGHSFLDRCRMCDYSFSKYEPHTSQQSEEIWAQLPKRIDVFYIERVTEMALQWTRDYREQGAIIFFEPNRMGDLNLFAEITKVSHVLKYSNERRSAIQEISDRYNPSLEIETFGRNGLQFRVGHKSRQREWKHIPSIPADPFRDACGSGDWLSAALIHSLFKQSNPISRIMDEAFLAKELYECQRHSSRNCAYEGARGMLYRDSDIVYADDFCPQCI